MRGWIGSRASLQRRAKGLGWAPPLTRPRRPKSRIWDDKQSPPPVRAVALLQRDLAVAQPAVSRRLTCYFGGAGNSVDIWVGQCHDRLSTLYNLKARATIGWRGGDEARGARLVPRGTHVSHTHMHTRPGMHPRKAHACIRAACPACVTRCKKIRHRQELRFAAAQQRPETPSSNM